MYIYIYMYMYIDIDIDIDIDICIARHDGAHAVVVARHKGNQGESGLGLEKGALEG